jgi:hypothetical protein
MKENPRIQFLRLLLTLSISFFILIISVSASSATGNQFVIYSVHSSNNHYTAEVTNNNNVVLIEDGQEIGSIKFDRQIGSIALSPDGDYLAVGCDGGDIYFYDTTWSTTLLWKRTFGTASIKSISFQENGNFIDATNVLNQAFLITRTGNVVGRPTTPSVTAIPSTISSSTSKTSTPTDYLPSNIDATGFLGINYYVWGIVGLIALWILWVNHSNNQKKGPTITYQPSPQYGTIYADSIPLGAKIYLDNSPVGVTPFTISNVLPGTHKMRAVLYGYDYNAQQITVNAGQTVIYSPTLQKIPSSSPPHQPQSQPKQPTRSHPPVSQSKSTFQDLINQLGAKAQQDREEAQKQLIIKVNTEGKPSIQQIIKELEKQPSGIKREIINLLYYLSKESHEGQKVTEELILALTYSSPEVKWLIVQTLGRLKDKRALSAVEAAASDTDFLVKYWAIISLKSIQES